MKDHPEQFLLKGGFKLPGILLHPVDAYVDIGLYRLPFRRILESDYVRIRVVLEKFLVHLKQVRIITKNIVDMGNPKPFVTDHSRQKSFQIRSAGK